MWGEESPIELWHASPKSGPPFQYMDLEATMGLSECICVDRSVFAMPATSLTLTVFRDSGGMVNAG
jgi:hypothetical protein